MRSPEPCHGSHLVLGAAWSRWLFAWTVAGSAGVCLALLLWPPSAVLAVALVPGATAALLFGVTQQPVDGSPRPGGSGGIGAQRVVEAAGRVGLCAGALVVAICAIASVLLALSLLVAVLAAATLPPVVERIGRGGLTSESPAPTSSERAAESVRLAVARPPETVDQMTDHELCWAWRHSYQALQSAPTASERAEVVALRQGYMDEMEARHAVAFAAWLASGPRPASGPDRFLTRVYRTSGQEGDS